MERESQEIGYGRKMGYGWQLYLLHSFYESERADSIIFIDFPRRISYLRVFLRRLRHRGETRPSVADGCPEKIDREFLEYIWSWRKRRRPQILRYLKRLDGIKDVFIFRNQKQIERFMQLLAIRTSWISKKSALYSEFVMHE